MDEHERWAMARCLYKYLVTTVVVADTTTVPISQSATEAGHAVTQRFVCRASLVLAQYR
jgi:hypothetical protein